MKYKSLIISGITFAAILIIGFCFSFLFDVAEYWVVIGFDLITMLANYIVCKRLNVVLDFTKTEFTDEKELLLNSIFVGQIVAIPVSLFVSFLFS